MQNLHKAKYIFLNGKIAENAEIFVDKGKIVEKIADCEVIDHGNALITPGFVNFHTHLQYTDLKPKAELKGFSEWIIDLIKQYFFWSKDKKIKSFQNGLRETVKSGVTCVVNLAIEEDFIEVVNNSGVKNYMFLETFADTEDYSKKEFKRLNKTLEKYNTYNVGISPHAPYSVHPSLWGMLSGCGVIIHTHLFESHDEMLWMSAQPSGIDKLRKFINRKSFPYYKIEPYENLIAAHLCQKTFAEVNGFNIAHCPRSNVLLHGKTLELSGDTSRVGLGTDGKSSNYDLNILHEARFLQERSSLSFVEILNMLTINPARMLKIDNSTGTLDPDKDADFLVFKLSENAGPESILYRDGPDETYIKGIKYN